jgi:sulfur carrier protein ThiS
VNKKIWLFLSIVILVTFAAGCEQATQLQTQATPQAGETFMIALPRLVLDVDADGNPSVLGIGPAVLKSLGLDLGGLSFPKETVKQMTDANVQHIELSFVGDGVNVLVNGQVVPHVAWTEKSLQDALGFAAVLGVQNAEQYSKLVPIANRLGLDVVLRFPRQPGAAEIPLAEPGRAGEVVPTPSTEPATAIVKMEVKYDENGNPMVMGLGAEDMASMGLAMPGALSPDTIKKFQAGNIQSLEFRTKPDGTYLYVNGNPLPNLVWDKTMLTNVAKLYGQLNPNSPLLEVINTVFPNLDRLDIDILMHLPLAPGAEAIPIQMH